MDFCLESLPLKIFCQLPYLLLSLPGLRGFFFLQFLKKLTSNNKKQATPSNTKVTNSLDAQEEKNVKH